MKITSCWFSLFHLIDVFPSDQTSDELHNHTSSDTTDSESGDSEDNDCNIITADSNITAQNNDNDINRPPTITKSIAGVRFINKQELAFVDKQHVQYPSETETESNYSVIRFDSIRFRRIESNRMELS